MPSASSHRCRLTWTLDGHREQVLLQGPRVVVGRSSQCDLTLRDESVSRHHAEFIEGPAGWMMRDLESRNGIEVNGKRVSERVLAHGDRLKIGNVALQCELFAPAAPPPKVVIDDTSLEPALRAVISMDTMVHLDAPPATPPAAAPPAKGAAAAKGGRAPAPSPTPAAAIDESTSLRQRLLIAAPLREAAEAVLSGKGLQDTLDRFLQIVAKHLRALRGFIGLTDAKSGELVPAATWTRAKEGSGPIVISRHIADAAMKAHQSILVGDAADDSRFAAAESIVSMKIRSAMCAPLLRDGKVGGLIYVDTLSVVEPFQRDSLEVLSILATLAAVAIEETKLREEVAREQRIRDKLARYSSSSVVNHIIAQQKDAADGAGMISTEREVSVLFCDFAGFTTFAETLAPVEVTRVLNRAFERLTAAVFAEEGTLDKYTGDGLMVFFGAPLDQPDHAARAVRTAVRMQRSLAEPVADGVPLPPLALRIGIHSGRVIVGDIGTPARSDYTAIGATVNTASRLESTVAKPGQVVIGPATYEAVKGLFHCQPLPEQLLRGMTKPIQPYLVLGEPEVVGKTPASAAAESVTPNPSAPISSAPTPMPPPEK
jgi:adenylate cyclase